MKAVWIFLAFAACGGKVDTGSDSGSQPDGTTTAPDTGTPDAKPSDGGSPQLCSVGIPTTTQTQTGCDLTGTWTCGQTQYTVQCSCPTATCTCVQQSGSSASATQVSASNICPGCVGFSQYYLANLCGFPQ